MTRMNADEGAEFIERLAKDAPTFFVAPKGTSEAIDAVLRGYHDYKRAFSFRCAREKALNSRMQRARRAIRLGRYEHALKLLDGRCSP